MSATTGTPDLAHVVHVVETLGMGGMERAIATLCRTLRARQIRTSVIAMKQLGAVADELRDMGVPVHLAGVPVSPPDYFAWRRLVPVLREVRPTVVHTHNSAPLIYGAPSARWCGVRRIAELGRHHFVLLAQHIAIPCCEFLVCHRTWQLIGMMLQIPPYLSYLLRLYSIRTAAEQKFVVLQMQIKAR